MRTIALLIAQGMLGSAAAAPSYCSTAVNRLKQPPEDLDALLAGSTIWTDSWEGEETIFFRDQYGICQLEDIDKAFEAQSRYYFANFRTEMPSAKLFATDSGKPSWSFKDDFVRSMMFVSSQLGGLATAPDHLRSAFVTQTTNSVGVAQLRFYLKGKPYLVTVDYQGIYERPEVTDYYSFIGEHLVQASTANYDMDTDGLWGYLLQKAWSKVKGNYDQYDGSSLANGMYAILGVPVVTYSSYGDSSTIFDTITAAHAAGYVSAFQQQYWMCFSLFDKGLSYAIDQPFTMTEGDTTYKAYLARYPWGKSAYGDSFAWTDNLVSQIPLAGFDPRISEAERTSFQGYFVMDSSRMGMCTSSIATAHVREAEGYSNLYFDKESITNGEVDYFKVDVPSVTGDLYFSVHGWNEGIVPHACLESSIKVSLFIWQSSTYLGSIDYEGYAHQPVIVSSYEAGTPIHAKVQFTYPTSHPSKDYTLVLYSKLTGPIQEATVDPATIPNKPEPTEAAASTVTGAWVEDPYIPKSNDSGLKLDSVDDLLRSASSQFEVVLGLIDRPALTWSALTSVSEWPQFLSEIQELPMF